MRLDKVVCQGRTGREEKRGVKQINFQHLSSEGNGYPCTGVKEPLHLFSQFKSRKHSNKDIPDEKWLSDTGDWIRHLETPGGNDEAVTKQTSFECIGWSELGGWKGKQGGVVVLMGWIWYTASFRRWGNVRQCPWTFLIDAFQPLYCCGRAVTDYSTEPCTEKDRETSNGLWLLSGRGIQTLQFSAELKRKFIRTHRDRYTIHTEKSFLSVVAQDIGCLLLKFSPWFWLAVNTGVGCLSVTDKDRDK